MDAAECCAVRAGYRSASKVEPPLIDECYAILECRVSDAHLARKYNFFVLEVVQAWIDPARDLPRTFHHQGGSRFVVDGKEITLPLRVK